MQLVGDALHPRVVGVGVQDHDPGGVAGERALGRERVNDGEGGLEVLLAEVRGDLVQRRALGHGAQLGALRYVARLLSGPDDRLYGAL